MTVTSADRALKNLLKIKKISNHQVIGEEFGYLKSKVPGFWIL